MSYLALARKYRPRSFGEVSTQEHVSDTLKRAVAGGRVGHAYLLCGPRGVGKTTIARILAMSLNCAERSGDGEPCGRCDSCDNIWKGHTSFDVVEIDAASNRGVGDARELRSRAQYAPSQEGRHKVYILDEAHMLTREAWNALLKVLEEPPPRVVFCFATTDARSIRQAASPILSRCQRFDFRRIGARDIAKRLGDVLDAEGLGFDPEAVRAIARKADGGMRDGLSLLDQVLALAGDSVTTEAVSRVLGLMAEDRFLEVLDILLEKRHADVFEFVERLVDDGHDLVEFFHELTERLRMLLRMTLDAESDEGAMAVEYRTAFAERAAAFAPGDLLRMLAMCSSLEANGSLRRTGRPRVLIEVLLLQLGYLDRTVELEEVIRALGGPPPGNGRGPGDAGDSAKGATANPSAVPHHRPRPSPNRRGLSAPGGRSSAPPGRPSRDQTSPSGRSVHGQPASPGRSPRGQPAPPPSRSSRGRRSPRSSGPRPSPTTRRERSIGRSGQRARTSGARPSAASARPRGGVPASQRPPGPRVTDESVRLARMREIEQRHPALAGAIAELDLEIVD